MPAASVSTSSRIARRSSAVGTVVPPRSVRSQDPVSAFRRARLNVSIAHGSPQDMGRSSEITGQGASPVVPIKLPLTPFARFRLLFLVLARDRRRRWPCPRCWPRDEPASPRGSCASLAALALARLLDRRLPPRPLLARARAARGAGRLRRPRRRPRRPVPAAARPHVPQRLRRPAARVRPLGAVDGRVLGAHDGRGPEQFDGDVARAMAMALVPFMCQALLAALRASEIIQRRLNSIVQNSTDVVTIVGADQRVRWQAESIRGVLGHEPDDDRRHPPARPRPPDDRPALDGYFAAADGQPGLRAQPDAAARPRRGRPPPLRRRRRQPPARPERRRLRAQHA